MTTFRKAPSIWPIPLAKRRKDGSTCVKWDEDREFAIDNFDGPLERDSFSHISPEPIDLEAVKHDAGHGSGEFLRVV